MNVIIQRNQFAEHTWHMYNKIFIKTKHKVTKAKISEHVRFGKKWLYISDLQHDDKGESVCCIHECGELI